MPEDATAVTFRSLARGDLGMLRRWLNTPHVYEWWGTGSGEGSLGGPGEGAATEADVEEKYGAAIDTGGATHRYVMELEGVPIGLIQWYLLSDYPEYARAIGEEGRGSAGVDFFIGEVGAIGRGIGPLALREFVATVMFRAEGVDRAVGGPASDNPRSIRTFEKAGFTLARYAEVEGEKIREAVMVCPRTRPTPS
jgi:aminoglycoside 6'-N-acetyltransferase